MKNVRNMTAVGPMAGRMESTLFSNLFNGKTAVEGNDELCRFLNSTHVVPYHISTPAQTHYASMACGNWTTTKEPLSNPEPSESARSYGIHVEISLGVDSPILVLLIKDEAGSYLAGSKLKGLTDPQAAACNCRRREDFIMQFRKECEVTDIQISNQAPWIGRAEYSYFGKTVEDVRNWLESTIEGIARAVGLAMYEIDEWTRLLTECDAEIDQPVLLTATAPITVDGGSERRAAKEELPFPTASEANQLASLPSDRGISE